VNQRLTQRNIPNRVPDDLDMLIACMLAKTPGERPGGMDEVRTALQRVLDVAAGQTLPPMAGQGVKELPPRIDEPELIAPLKVTERAEQEDQPEKRRPLLSRATLLVLAFVAILAGGAFLLQYLAKHPIRVTAVFEENLPEPKEHERRSDETAATDAQQSGVNAHSEQPEAGKEQAERKLAELVLARKGLDDKGVSQWGVSQYATMVERNEQADNLLMRRQYAEASKKYDEALDAANELNAQTGAVLKRHMTEGREALAQADGKRAGDKFRVALMIEPSNQEARRSLKRAENLDTVMALMASGKQHEQQNKLSLAHADYQQALRLDPQSDEARQAVRRSGNLIARHQFRQFMSSGFEAYHKGDYQRAQAAFLSAKKIRPDSQEAKDALAQVDQGFRLTRIESLRNQALAAEKAEDWNGALEAYTRVLKLDGAIQFALLGKERSQNRIRITKHIDYYLNKPHVLESDQMLANAILLLEEASSVEPKGPQLTNLVTNLAQVIKTAKTPVRVSLESDNLTEVAVYKVGRLGKFDAYNLNLRPGTYTVVGTRDGYKDVRLQVIVKPDRQELRVSVKCSEKI
jgi:hypothetical protein